VEYLSSVENEYAALLKSPINAARETGAITTRDRSEACILAINTAAAIPLPETSPSVKSSPPSGMGRKS
jgi:hypothetical protein